MRYFYKFVLAYLVAVGILCYCVLVSFTGHYDVKNNTAEVNTYDGIIVFSDCMPVREYTVLGSVKPKGRGSMALGLKSEDYNGIRSSMVDQCKENYPGAEAIILHLATNNRYADCIKFK